jgi:hypothetical protein
MLTPSLEGLQATELWGTAHPHSHHPWRRVKRHEVLTTRSVADVEYDYEEQICRAAEPVDWAATVPASDAVDGEFWLMLEGVRQPAVPIFNDDSGAIVAWR